MKTFDLAKSATALLTPEIVQMLSTIHEHKGRQALFLQTHADEVQTLLNVAFIQSVDSSNRIEGIYTSNKRLQDLAMQKTMPRNRSEQEIAGYREVLATIHENYTYMMPTLGIILQMHRDMFSYTATSEKGVFKDADNIIAEIDSTGERRTRFVPVAAHLTPQAVDDLCENLKACWNDNTIDKLLLIALFVFDFLCIHPFNDGNGRLSRLLTLLLLYKAGYYVGKYISIERLIEQSKETYYAALEASSTGWHNNCNDYAPFVQYYLGVLIKAFSEFDERIEHVSITKLSKHDRVIALIEKHMGRITKREIIECCPDISNVTVERVLADLVKRGRLQKVGAGPRTAYVCVDDGTA